MCTLIGGCTSSVSQSQGEAGNKELEPKAIAQAAKQQLLEKLTGRLTEVLQSRGPVAAISVCSQEAERIAAETGDELGVKIGRTSTKKRNPNNVPPAWAAQWVEQQQAEEHFVELEGNTTGALFPIKLQAKCLMCHGPQSQIAEPIQNQLDELYPQDAATGFQEGDLRGWVWVEVPGS